MYRSTPLANLLPLRQKLWRWHKADVALVFPAFQETFTIFSLVQGFLVDDFRGDLGRQRCCLGGFAFQMGNVSYTSSLIHVSMLEHKWADHHSTRKEPFPKRMGESSSIVELGFHQIIQSRNIYTICYIRICETLWNIKSAQRAMETAWNIYVQASNVDNRKLHNRKATPQFAVINCAFILLWYSFPHTPRMG